MFTKWAAEAWEDYSTNNQAEITAAFKRCGMFNDVDGRENHLVKVQGCPDYEVPAKGSEPEPVVEILVHVLVFVFNFLSSCNRSYLSISNFFIF